jgi:protein-S-isoprenylcysteine O-methyltransferase Ste14
MAGILAVLYGATVYLVFLGTFLYAIAFVGNLGPWKTIDAGTSGASPAVALLVDAALLALFAVQHSVMARPAFKRWWTRFVPSTYVLSASLVLIALYAFWQPFAAPVWTLTGAAAAVVMAVFWLGWALVLVSTFLINHFELFGLAQVYERLRGARPAPATFKTPLFYNWVRHPIYLGFLLAFWATPTMTVGHLLFAAATTGYILLGIFLEERDLVAQFGEQYRNYRRRVSMLIPWPRRRQERPAREIL